jgi:TIR domain
MTRVFLSFASADSAAAERFAQFWVGLEVKVFWFNDPDRPVGRVVGEVERQLAEADLFVVLLSPQYLESRWCEEERDLAIQRGVEMSTPFVHVIKVAETPPGDSGLLRNYHWRLNEISARLPLGSTVVETAAEAVAEAKIPGFRNRLDELANLRGALQTPGGRELWVVVAPPLMGKTWLLTRLEQALSGLTPHWTIQHLDLREAPAELRTNPTRLVGNLLDVDTSSPQEPLLDDDLRDIAAQVSFRAGPQLFVLDSAELLAPACATSARSALTAVRRLVRRTGRGGRIGLVIGTRRHDEWRGLGSDARTGERFEPLRLTEFGHDIVHQALLDLSLRFGEEELWIHAAALHRLSEGLPALLVKSVQWAQYTAFLQIDRADSPLAFDAVARDYIENDLLSADSLLPMGGPRPTEALTVLRKMLRVLSTYRLYTQSHLKFHLDADPALQQALADAHWTQVELWDAVGQTALGTQQAAHEIWHEIEPPLRRLLHRHHYRTDDERIAAHTMARRFYGGWTQHRAAGREQQVVLVESLWHEAFRLAIEQPDALARLLPGVAEDLARTFGNSPMYEPAEFSEAVVRRLHDDDELKVLLSSRKGLFEEIVKSVSLTIGCGR